MHAIARLNLKSGELRVDRVENPGWSLIAECLGTAVSTASTILTEIGWGSSDGWGSSPRAMNEPGL